MEFLAHRGFWTEKRERNTLAALKRALDEGYGLETDVRDLDGLLVVSHDMPRAGEVFPLEALFAHYRESGCGATLALNVKADGLQEELSRLLREYGVGNYFVFDMSVPDTLGYLKHGMRTFVRRSDLESTPALAARTQGVWLDELTGPWITAEVIAAEAAGTPALCIVSAELHGRAHLPQWGEIARGMGSLPPGTKILLCTDHPDEAERHFR